MKGKKITSGNYFETIKQIGFENLPLVLKQSHTVIVTKTINGEDWSKYKSDVDLKRMIDLVFKKLEEFIASKKKNINGINDEEDLSGNYLTPKDVAINLIKPSVLKGNTIDLHASLRLSVKDVDYEAHVENESVIVTMLYGTEISESFLVKDLMDEIIRDDLKTKYHTNDPSQGNSVRKKRTTFNHKQPEFKVLKAILNWHNASVSKRQVEFFINELQGYIQSKKITKKSPVAKEIALVQQKLISIFNSMGEQIKIELSPETKKIFQSALMKVTDVTKFNKPEEKKGLGEISVPVTQKQAPQQNIMSSMDFANLTFNTIGLKDKWLDFIGDPAPGFTAMVYGRPKMGKSYLCVDFAGYLARNHSNVLYVAKEERLDASLQKKLKDKDVAHPNLFVSDNLPKNLSEYKFVVLDSVNKLGLNPKDLEKLKSENPGVSFIYVFQATKEGKFRGTNEFQHDVDVIIEVPKKGIAIQNGRFNQGAEMNIFENSVSKNDELSGIEKSKKKVPTTQNSIIDFAYDMRRPSVEGISKNSKHNLTLRNNVSKLDATKNKTMKKTEKKVDWTESKNLKPADWTDLKNVKKLIAKGKLKEAMKYASDLDTIVREEIPPEIWQSIGGELTKTGKEKLATKFNSSKYDNRVDDLNPRFIFSMIATQLLTEALKGEFDINYLIRKELANRGQDKNGKWVGFDKAKEIHQVK